MLSLKLQIALIAALTVTSTVKSASRIGLEAQDKNRPVKAVMNTEEERNRILSSLRNLKGQNPKLSALLNITQLPKDERSKIGQTKQRKK